MGVTIMDESKRLLKRHAIVLYTFQKSDNRVALLDSACGKVVCYTAHTTLQIGAHIEYQLVKKRRHFMAHDIEVVRMPFAIARDDILFLHHVLEMCYHFIPEGMVAEDIFALIEFMYHNGEMLSNAIAKKLYLSKLFILFGIYPEKPYINLSYWQVLLERPIEVILEQKDTSIVPTLTIWLRSCIYVHPLAHTFKTLEFLNVNE